jgi:hypothetical protein
VVIAARAHKRLGTSPPYGLEPVTQVPAIATVPGAPLASTKTINIKVGAAIKRAKR